MRPEHVAKRIEEMLVNRERIWIKFDDAASSYEELARELEEIARGSTPSGLPKPTCRNQR
jgi:hypothetical protein